MPFTSCNYRWQAWKKMSLYFLLLFFIIIIYHVFLISFLFYTDNVLYYGTTAFQKIYFWEPICTELPIYQSVHFYWIASLQRSHFVLFSFFFSLVTFFFLFQTVGICLIWYRDAMWHNYYFALNKSEAFISSVQQRTDVEKSENYIKPQMTELKRVLNTGVIEAA